ncbi:MAG TPA: protein phosphatase 2C domain-containing protein [Kofleriaceae bacterium]
MTVSAMSDVGRIRDHNEDAFAIMDLASGSQIDALRADRTVDVHEKGVLLALSDGMGGAEAGEVASALVLESLQKALEKEVKGAIHEQLESAVQRANRNVFFEAKLENREGMGATLVALFIRGDEAYIAEVGDSRGYLLRKGRLRQITRDQSLVQLLVDQGVMTEDEARHSPSKNVILQAMGLAKDVRVAIARLRLRRGDRFMLCSDGVTNPVADSELQQILTGSEPRAACDTMIALANERGGDDNQTAIVADLTGDALPLPDEFETVTETYEVLKRYDATYKGKPVTQGVAQQAADRIRARSASKPPFPSPVADSPSKPHAVPKVEIAKDADKPTKPEAEKDAKIEVASGDAAPEPVADPPSDEKRIDITPIAARSTPAMRARSHSTAAALPLLWIIGGALLIVAVLLLLVLR